MSDLGWIAVDLDGTLAHYEKFVSDAHIGSPIPAMVDRVKRWLADKRMVIIFTARLSHPDCNKAVFVAAVDTWCLKHIGQTLPVTCVKDWRVNEFWDDRAIAVERNTGRVICASFNAG